MAIPRVFISSTCYDLKHIRENLKYFIRTIGYDPVLSDEGDVFYGPSTHTHDACLKEVSTCNLFVLIIGGRYGGYYRDSETSITNNEYKEAVCSNVPVFALVEYSVYSDHHLYISNRKKNPDFADKIAYPACDNIKIFDFIDEVRKKAQNNALFPFKDFSDIESYLKKQWAGMMFDFLSQQIINKNTKITNKLLDDLSLATRKSEELIKVLLKATSGDSADNTIQSISDKVEAENFIRLLLSKFNMYSIPEIHIDILINEIPDNWIDFACLIDNFLVDEFPNGSEVDRVLCGPNGHGILIGHYENGMWIEHVNSDLEKAYNAFKSVDDDTKKYLLNKLAHGF